MRNLFFTVSAMLMFGIASAQVDTVHTKKTTTVKKSEKVVKKQQQDGKVTRTNTTQPVDSINRSTNPIPKPKAVNPEPDNPKIQDPVKPE